MMQCKTQKPEDDARGLVGREQAEKYADALNQRGYQGRTNWRPVESPHAARGVYFKSIDSAGGNFATTGVGAAELAIAAVREVGLSTPLAPPPVTQWIVDHVSASGFTGRSWYADEATARGKLDSLRALGLNAMLYRMTPQLVASVGG